jgi:hypothetical protein
MYDDHISLTVRWQVLDVVAHQSSILAIKALNFYHDETPNFYTK